MQCKLTNSFLLVPISFISWQRHGTILRTPLLYLASSSPETNDVRLVAKRGSQKPPSSLWMSRQRGSELNLDVCRSIVCLPVSHFSGKLKLGLKSRNAMSLMLLPLLYPLV